MSKTNEHVMPALEMAPAPIPFLENDYFKGLCEIAAAQKLGKPLFIPVKNMGVFNSLYYKRVFGRVELADGSYQVGNFDLNNRYLVDQFGQRKEANWEKFSENVKAIVNGADLTVFSFTEVKYPEISVEDLF